MANENMLTLKMRGKMAGFTSISTACSTNQFCQSRIENAIRDIRNFSEKARDIIDRYMLPSKHKLHLTGTETVNALTEIGCPVCICIFCYADKAQKFQHGTKDKGTRNAEFLSVERCADELPSVNPQEMNGLHPFRFEALGDLGSVAQAKNYLRMCMKNNADNALWTKNAEFLWKAVVEMGGKPKNVQFIFSSAYVNTPDRKTYDAYNKMCREKFGYNLFDKLFTVWTANIAHRYAIEFNCCGSGDMKDRRCSNCLNCYKSSGYNEFVNELLR